MFLLGAEAVNSIPGKGEVCTATSAMIALQRAPQQLGTMEQLEEELTCPVCCGLFEDPRVLLCSHSFCKKCLEGLLEGNRGPAFRTPLKCPTCRKETPHNGASSLQVNYSLRGIVDKFSKIKVMPKMSACKQHCGQPLNIFCATDLRLICGICATTDEHRGHGFSSLEEAYEREKGAFGDLLQEAESWQSADTLSCLETLQASKKKALQSVGRDAEKVADYFDKLIGSLECKKSEILSDFETLKLVVMQAYDPEISKLSAALEEQSRALGLAESVRGVSDPLCFLQNMQEFREKIKVLKETALPSRKDMDVGPLVRNFDVKKWDSLRLREIDKISVPHESGAYQTGGSRMSWSKWIVLSLAFLSTLPIIFLSPPYTAIDVTSRIPALITESVPSATLYLQEISDMCAGLIEAGQEHMMRFISDLSTTFTHYLS
ncbi:tripartite motif-containing 13 isoform X1 [Xiphophorus hellerii]|uniref:tripartite motif-containing 13 isoform X1 n=2 Tax=Xiphophorus hellerii TaxID=8084 RepID=UPI0013B3BBD4|nr:E3 ubiquitin-protein ligase TRIM13 isoform X1 [Xiphophorus hellerii]